MKSNEPIDILRGAIRDGTAILFAGPGLSAFAGYPNRRQQIRQMIARPDFPDSARQEIESTVKDGSIAINARIARFHW